MAFDEYYFVHAELSLAAYANLFEGRPSLPPLEESGMSSVQAGRFADQWEVVDQYNHVSDPYPVYNEITGEFVRYDTDTNGLSVTVFEEKATGQRYLAIRGTDDLYDVATDTVSVAILGSTRFQAQYQSLKLRVQEWMQDGTLPRQYTVTGHSLGGFLATGLASEFSANVTHAYLYNSPGVGSVAATQIGQKLLEALQIVAPLVDPGHISNIRADAGISPIAGMGLPVSPSVRIAIENQYASDVAAPPAARNHSQQTLTDALAVFSVYGELVPNISVPFIESVIRSASNQNKLSLENSLDAARRIVLGAGATSTAEGNREAIYTNLSALTSSEVFKALKGKATLTLATTSLATTAKTDFAAFLSLHALSPVVISTTDAGAIAALKAANTDLAAAWTADYNARLYGETTKMFDYSDSWYADRAAMLGKLIERNKADVAEDDPVGQLNGRSVLFLDGDSVTRVEAGAIGAMTDFDVVAFGKSTDDVAGELSGAGGKDRLYGLAGDDTLIGYGGNDYLEGGSGTDTYAFSGAWGKDTIVDIDGRGNILLGGSPLGQTKAVGDNVWNAKLDSGAVVLLQLLESTRSATGKTLLITQEGDSSNSITINNFDATQAKTEQGYLGIKLDPEVKVFLGNSNQNPFEAWDFDPNTFTGQTEMGEGLGKRFVVWLNQTFTGDDTLTLQISDELADTVQAILGDSKVPANGAVIQLAPGQTHVSFALVQEGDITADLPGAISVSYNGDGQSATSNSWGLNVKNAGEITRIYLGDQRALLWGIDLQPDPVVNPDGSVTLDIITEGDARYNTYAWSKTQWAADGSLTGGVAEAGFSDVIYGSSGNNEMQGLGGNDALDGGAGNDQLEGGTGDDLLAGGAGSDHILGGAGNDVIVSATTMDTLPRLKPDDRTDLTRIVGNVLVNGGPLEMDSAADVIEGGDGDDEVFAGHGDDRIDGGNGADDLYGLGGDDVLEGGAGIDQLLGDGVTAPGTYGTATEGLHGSDFLDGGESDDKLIGGGKGDVLYGGVGDDDLYGDETGDVLAGQYHGDDYLDGEDGIDRLWGNGANDTLYGGLGNDKLFGDAKESELAGEFHGDDYLDGEDGEDELVGFGGNDTLHGGAGADYLAGDAAESELAGQFNGEDYLDGEDGDDVLLGGGKADVLYGGAGDDELQGDGRVDELGARFHGDDVLDGEDGDDVLIGDGGSDTLYGGTGNDYLAGDNAAALGEPNHLQGEFHGSDELDGGAGDDTLVGDGGTDTLLGGAGNDTLLGDDTLIRLAEQFHGNDVLDGGDGNDALYGGGGEDVLLGGMGNDLLAGEASPDYMDGGAGDDTYLAGAGDTVVDDSNGANALTLIDGEPVSVTASGADLLLDYGPNGLLTITGALTGSMLQIDSMSSFDWIGTRLSTEVSLTTTGEYQTVSGGTGNDVLGADHVGASLYGGAGDDVLTGGGNFVRMNGGEGNDVLRAGDGGSEMSGGVGNDTMDGGAGSDWLSGGAGDDILAGGAGQDTYYMSYGMGADRVIDDTPEGGVVQLAEGLALDSLAALRLGSDMLLQLDSANSLRLQGYFDAPAEAWVIKDGQGNSSPISNLPVLADPATAQDEQALVQVEQLAYRNQLEAGIRFHYAALNIANFSRYQTQADGTIRAQGTPYLYGWESTASTSRYYRDIQYGGVIYRLSDPPIKSSGLTSTPYPVADDLIVIRKVSSDPVAEIPDVSENYAQTVNHIRQSYQVNWGAPNYTSTWTYSYTNTNPGYVSLSGKPYIFLSSETVYSTSAYTGQVQGVAAMTNQPQADGSLPTILELDTVKRVVTHTIQTVNLSAADNTAYASAQTIVNAGDGNDTVYDAGYAYGGSGNDTLLGGGTLRGGDGDDFLRNGSWMAGGAGNDILIGGQTMVAGSGRDEIYAGIGAATIVIDPALVTECLVGGKGDSTYFLAQYYESLGIYDWQERREYSGLYLLRYGDGQRTYGTEDELVQWLPELGPWVSYAQRLAISFAQGLADGSIQYIAPLPPAPLAAANDFRALETYYEQGVLQHHTVAFGAGVAIEDLRFSWSQLDVAVSGEPEAARSPHAVLNISWNGGLQKVQVIIPQSDEPLGSGISRFTFADGSVMNTADMLDLAPPAVNFDPHREFLFEDGSGEVVIDGEIQLLGFNFNRNELEVSRDGTDLLLAHSGTSDLVRLTDWYGQPGAYQGFEVMAADGAALTQAELTFLSLIGLATLGSLSAVVDVEEWSRPDGAYGRVVYYADDYSERVEYTADDDGYFSGAMYFVVSDDDNGNRLWTELDQQGILLGTGRQTWNPDTNRRDYSVFDGTGALRYKEWSGPDGQAWTRYDANGRIQELALNCNRDELKVSRDGTDLLLAHSGTSDVVRLSDWYGQPGVYQGFEVMIADGAALTQAELTFLSLIGLATLGSQSAVVDVEEWSQPDGGYGRVVYYADDSYDRVSYETYDDGYFPGAMYFVVSDDDKGNRLWTELDQQGVLLGTGRQTWNPDTNREDYSVFDSTGKLQYTSWWGTEGSGWTDYDADGTSEGATYKAADDSYSYFYNDGVGTITTQKYQFGEFVGSVIQNDDGQGNVLVTNFDAMGVKVSVAWTSVDGSSGFETFVDNENHAPVRFGGQGALAVLTEDVAQVISLSSLLQGTMDVDGDALSVENLRATHGVLSPFDPVTETWRFTPEVNYNGSFELTYVVSDGAASLPISRTLTIASVNDAPTGEILVTGTVSENETLTVSDSLSDGDGLGAVSYQWMADGLPVTGAVNATLLLTSDLVGKSISVVASYVDGYGNQEIVASPATAAVVPALVIPNIVGTGGADRMTGTPGVDVLEGLVGNDIYTVNHVADTVLELADEGVDTVQSVVDYTLRANVENLTLTGTGATSGTGNELNNVITGNAAGNTLSGMDGNDTLRGGLEADVLLGGEGNDRLDGGAGADQMSGGAGNDTYVVDQAADGVSELIDEGTDTVQSAVDYTLGANVENLTLTGAVAASGTGNGLNNVITGNTAGNTLNGLGGNDTLRGGLETDVLMGGEGNDRLDGGAGADQMAGGAGNDTYVVDQAADGVSELADEGTDTVQSAVDYTLGTNLENLTLTGSHATNGMGNELNNVITGNIAGNTLNGLGGHDTLRGNAEADVLLGGEGNDRLDGGAGADQMAGGAGNDTYVVDAAGDVVTELADEGTDTVQSLVDYALGANLENLTLTGAAATNGTGNEFSNVITGNVAGNVLRGLGGNDTLRGGLEADVLDGGEGSDRLEGGAGADTYLFARGEGQDTIVETDPTAGVEDVLQFGHDITAEQIWLRQVGNSLEISLLGSTDKVMVSNWYLGTDRHMEALQLADGRQLLDSQVQNLVQAMASFSPPAAGQTTLPANYASTLTPVIAASWQ